MPKIEKGGFDDKSPEMQRILYKGVPVWRDSEKNLYVYEPGGTPNLKIGTESGGFREDWKDIVESKLQSFRESLEVRNRKSAGAPADKK